MKSNTKKRLIAFMLCMVLVLSSTISAFADEPQNTDSQSQTEAVAEPAADEATGDEAAVNSSEQRQQEEQQPEQQQQQPEQQQQEQQQPEQQQPEAEAPTVEAPAEQPAAEEAQPIQQLTYEDDNVKITVDAVESGNIPEGATLSVTPIIKQEITDSMSDEEKAKAEELNDQYDHTEKKLNEKAENETYNIAGFLAYDITFVDADGNKMEPNGNVKISMDYKKAEIPEEAKKALEEKKDEQKLDVTVMHLEEDEQGEVKEVVDMVADETKEATVETTETKKVKKAEFVTNSFSVFALTWQNSLSSLETRGTTTTVTITDDIINSGALKANCTSDSVKNYTWYRSSKETGTYTKVDVVNYNTGSEIKTNISQDQTQLFPAYDNGEATGARQWYKVEVELTNGEKITSKAIQVTYFKELQNGGFETPTATDFSTQYSNAYYKEEKGVWQTTGTNNGKDIEIARQNLGSASSYAWNKVAGKLFSSDGTSTNTDGTYEDGHDWANAAYEGDQFAELNCEASGALYQDVLTKDGTALNYWLSHRARGNSDSNYVITRKELV